MERRDLILELCHKSGDTGPEEEIVEEWEANHACCCTLHVDKAAHGDVAILDRIRTCMGLVEKC